MATTTMTVTVTAAAAVAIPQPMVYQTCRISGRAKTPTQSSSRNPRCVASAHLVSSHILCPFSHDSHTVLATPSVVPCLICALLGCLCYRRVVAAARSTRAERPATCRADCVVVPTSTSKPNAGDTTSPSAPTSSRYRRTRHYNSFCSSACRQRGATG